MPLLRLPNELLLLIAESLTLSERTKLILANRQLHNLLTSDFYRSALSEDGGTRGLRFAATTGSETVARVFILRYGVDADLRFRANGMQDQTCLHVAAAKGHADLIRVLLQLGADVMARNETGRTPLHNAAHSGELEVSEVLVENGAEIMARDEVEQTPLHSAAKKGWHKVCHFLLEKGAEVDAMCKDPQNEVDDGYTSLHAAADFGHAEVAELLLQRGARVDAKIEQSEWTPLGCASAEGHEAVVKHLLRFGAEVNIAPEVPLRLAVDGKWHEGVLRLLLRHGADVERALEGLALTETATRLTEFAERWRSGEKFGDEEMGEGEDADGDMKMTMPQVLTTPEDTTMLENLENAPQVAHPLLLPTAVAV